MTDAIADTAPLADEELTPEDAFKMLGIDASELVIDDDDPFAGLDPQWSLLAKHLMVHFDPATLPEMMRPFAPAMTAIMANKLASEPAESREMTLELINTAVRDLAIDFTELECWQAHDMPVDSDYGVNVVSMVGRPLEPTD